jgi:hypothetical protein
MLGATGMSLRHELCLYLPLAAIAAIGYALHRITMAGLIAIVCLSFVVVLLRLPILFAVEAAKVASMQWYQQSALRKFILTQSKNRRGHISSISAHNDDLCRPEAEAAAV